MINRSDAIQNFLMTIDRRAYSLLVGLLIGAVGAAIAVTTVMMGPAIATGLIIGLLAGLYVLTDVQAALYAIVAVMLLLPYGTLPFDLGFTPTLLDVAISGFLLIYLVQWMTGKRRELRLTPVHLLLLVYVLWLVLAFSLGLRWAPITANVLRQFAGTLLSLGLVFIAGDLLRDPKILRRLVLVVMVVVSLQALLTIGLYVLPDTTADALLARLARIGYPAGGSIRYIEENPALAERAIGTWIDPNSLGGILAISAVIIAPQVFARRPVFRYRVITLGVLALVGIALFLTYSRTSMLAMAVGLGVIAVVRYRRFIPLLLLTGLLMLLLPQTQAYVERFAEALTFSDLASQMRLGEYTDSLRLINRYPVFGVGFTGTPDADIYTDVANMYLIMANQIGLVGVTIFLVFITGVFGYGVYAYNIARADDQVASIHLGYHAALVTALVNAFGDLYFFRLDFQASITMFWLTVTLALASSRLALERQPETESTVAKAA
jgi:polysaccharide biosynthesis protein PslJ